MAYINVAEWSPDQVTDWLKGMTNWMIMRWIFGRQVSHTNDQLSIIYHKHDICLSFRILSRDLICILYYVVIVLTIISIVECVPVIVSLFLFFVCFISRSHNVFK